MSDANHPAKLALKALTLAATSPVRRGFGWSMPVQNADGSWTPGAWRSVKGPVQYRSNGLHVCTAAQVGYWMNHIKSPDLTVWVVEYDGQVSHGKHGFAVRRARVLCPWAGEEV